MSNTPYWYCQHCQVEVDAHNVTFQELHDSCGHAVEWIDGIDLDRLTEICAAERDGRVCVLPCKVGTSVFDISDGTAYETRVLNFVVGRDGVSCKTVSSWPDVSEFGTRIFLTRESAEAALKEAQHE